MTQPVQEPSGQRTDANLTWGEKQLRRRPAPQSAGSYAYARFQRVSTSNQNVTSGINTVVVGTSTEDVITDASIFQINSHQEIEMLVDGLVAVVGYTNWDTYDTSWRQISVWDVGHVTSSVDWPIAMGGSGSDLYDPAIAAGTYRALIGSKLRLVAAQHSGGLQTLYGGGSDLDNTNWLEVQYLGTFQ